MTNTDQQTNKNLTNQKNNIKVAEILSRPRIPKKQKQKNKNNKITNNNLKLKLNEQEIEKERINEINEDDELIEELLNQTNEMNLSTTSSPTRRTKTTTTTEENIENQRIIINETSPTTTKSNLITKRIHDLGEDLKEVAHAFSSSININTSSTVTLINSKRKNNRVKDKIAKRQAAQLQAQLDAQLELTNNHIVDQRKIETDAIIQICKSLNLKVIDITPDGHCLYSAISDQLNLKDNLIKNETSSSESTRLYNYKKCRILASEYMRKNQNEFIHYLPAKDDGLEDGLMSDLDYQKYCDLVRNSARWGGQPEILALSKSLKFSIHIIQAFQPIIKICQDEFYEYRGNLALIISYHRKSYGLGEHYNSLRPI